MYLTPSRVTQKPKYSIWVCPNNEFLIFHSSPFILFYSELIPVSVDDLFKPLLLRSKGRLFTHG